MSISLTASSSSMVTTLRAEHRAITLLSSSCSSNIARLSFSSSHSNSLRYLPCLRIGLQALNSMHHRPRALPLGRRRQLEVASLVVEYHPAPDVSQFNGLTSQVWNVSVEAKKQTFSTFDELLKISDKPLLVDFYATWCGPCQFMVPILNQVGDSMKDQIQIVKIDTEKYPAIADEYKIQALPTFILFKDGKPCDRFEGALPADQFIKRIEATLETK